MSKEDILRKHLEFKKTSVSSENKLKDLERYIGKFINYKKKSLEKFDEDDVSKFINYLPYSINTLNSIKVHLKVFIKWYFPDWSLRFRNLDRICKQKKAPRTYTPEDMITLKEIKKIVEADDDIMYKTYWVVFFYGGFRPAEACKLKWENVFFEKKGVIIKLHATKTGKDFYKSLPLEAELLLKQWRDLNSSEWVFPSPINKNKPINPKSICGRLKKISKKAIGKEVVPYALRHSIATILYNDENRKDDLTAQQLGHHKSMKDIYLHLNQDGIKANARKIWIKPKELSLEQREEFEKKLSVLSKDITKLQKKDLLYQGGFHLMINQLAQFKKLNKGKDVEMTDEDKRIYLALQKLQNSETWMDDGNKT